MRVPLSPALGDVFALLRNRVPAVVGGRADSPRVGSGGRAAILIRGLKRATPGKPYAAWIVTPGAVPVRAARFVGTERAVFLSTRLHPKQRVIVSSYRPVGVRPANGRFVAVLG